LNIADVNQSGTVTNADIQATLNLLAGGGSLAAVPEPSSLVLCGMGAALFLFYRTRKKSTRNC
jgi:hypothetical protein